MASTTQTVLAIFGMKLSPLLALALLLPGCGRAPALTPPTTQAAALVRLGEELAILAPLVATDSASQPWRRYYTFTPATADSAGPTYSLAEAKQQLRTAPDVLNQVADTPFFGPITTPQQRAARQARLQALLAKQPALDLGWVWLAALQKDPAPAIAYLSKALALNNQVGTYYQRRAGLYQQQGDYRAAARDLRRALPLCHPRWRVHGELANVYLLLHDDQQYTATWSQRQTEMRQALGHLERRPSHDLFWQDSVRRLRDEIAYGYLANALYFIERRHQPALGCPDLARAAAAGATEALALQRQYCQPRARQK